MKRSLYTSLCDWKADAGRRPLILRGARQTGKTYLVAEFGRNEFDDLIVLNFERNPEYKDIFSSYDPAEVIEKISLFTRKIPQPGKTLLFLDEIQECPSAILALRYFYEEMPDLHIIGAGSLLEFALNSEEFRMPVGRIQYIFLHPLSFNEFLLAIGEEELKTYISELDNLTNLPEALHLKLIEYVRKYCLLGGMPAVVNEYIKNKDYSKCTKIQKSILDTYIDDFAKYSRVIKHKYLKKVFHSIPAMVGHKFVYSHVDREIKSRDLKEAVNLLETAGIIHRVRQTSGAGLPLEGAASDSFYKLVFLDVGLFHALGGIRMETINEKDLTAVFKGAVAEQFTGQELRVNHSEYQRASLFYWARKARNSTSEVDYLIDYHGKVIPLEVKSGPRGHMRSMGIFLDKYPANFGVKVSQAKFHRSEKIISIPFYAIGGFLRRKL